jgi:hypothetical protein
VIGYPLAFLYVEVGRFMYMGLSMSASTKAFSTSIPVMCHLFAAAIVSMVHRDLYLAVGANVSS